MSQIWSRSARVHLAVSYARNSGLYDSVCRAVGGDLEMRQDSDGMLALADFIDFLEALGRHEPLAGVRAGLAFEPRVTGALGYSLANATKLRDAMAVLSRFASRIARGASFTVEETGDLARMIYRPPPQQDTSRVLEELTAAGLVGFLRNTPGLHIVPQRVDLPGAPATDPSRYEGLLQCPVRFNQPVNAIVLRSRDLERRIPGADPALFPILEDTLDRTLQEDPAEDLITAARRSVLAGLSSNSASIEDVARNVGMSVRTLQRRLDAAGKSFRAVVDDVRLQEAHRLLTQGDAHMARISYLLGYSEPAAFVRAFRRWTGMTPSEYRRRNGGAVELPRREGEQSGQQLGR